MLVSEKPHTERTVSLEPGDHPFVQRTSNVDFGTARYIPVSKLEDALRSGEAALKEDMSMNLLLRVQHGLLASTHTPHDVVESCRRVFEHQKRP
jgi:hypothetical protein